MTTPNNSAMPTALLSQKAIQLYTEGKFLKAREHCLQLLKDNQLNSTALNLLGCIENNNNNYQQAIQYFQAACKIAPSSGAYQINLGIAYYQLAEFGLAQEVFTKILLQSPNNTTARYHLGLVLQKQNLFTDAIQNYQLLLEQDPQHLDTLNNISICLLNIQQLEQAIIYLKQALKINPNSGLLHTNLGLALHKKSFTNDQHTYNRIAKQHLLKATELSATSSDAWNNLGNVLVDLQEPDNAIHALQQALTLNHLCPTVNFNLANAYKANGDIDTAIKYYNKVINNNPDAYDALFNKSICLFLNGDFKNGWKYYSYRWQTSYLSRVPLQQDKPTWNGKQTNKIVLIWPEQGIGDQIMFLSMLPEVISIQKKLIIACEPRLMPLLSRSFPQVKFMPLDNKNIKLDCYFDQQISMGGLGAYFKNDPCTIQHANKYLKANPQKIQELRKKYTDMFPKKIIIGCAWHSYDKQFGKLRSCPIENWKDLFMHPDCQFINLQYKDQTCADYLYVDNDINQTTSLDDFASQIAALDLIISIDNTLVHLAGALGKPVWILLPSVPDWRWKMQGTRTVWYHTAKLFRKKKYTSWKQIMQQLLSKL